MLLIESDPSTTNVSRYLSRGNLVMIRGFIDRELCADALLELDSIDVPRLPQPVYQRGLSFRSTYDGGSSIGYVRLYGGPSDGMLREIYLRMLGLAEPIRRSLGGATGDVETHHMEILTYQPGASFNRHRHDLHPQMLGLILLLSDPNLGGTVFHMPDSRVDTSSCLGTGDLLLFPWDIEHEVTPAVERPRTVALLPYY